MGKITELTITKGRTLKAEDREEWIKLEFSVKALVDDQNDMEAARAHLEGLLDGWLSASLPVAKPQELAKPNKPSADLFPEDLKQLLVFEENSGFLIVKPRQFLGSENFAKIADIVKAHGGEYISAGKSSHFRIPIPTKTN